jgi:hypothetical protein
MNNLKMITAMKKFMEAYREIDELWSDAGLDETEAIKLYPFDHSFDELNINGWCTATIDELTGDSYEVILQEYFNSGGGCMVGIYTIYDSMLNRTLFLCINEEGGTLTTVDYIRGEIDMDGKMIVDVFNVNELDPGVKHFDLYRSCFMDYVKHDCERFGTVYHVPFDVLPDVLQQTVSADYYDWQIANGGDKFATNGVKVLEDENYL